MTTLLGPGRVCGPGPAPAPPQPVEPTADPTPPSRDRVVDLLRVGAVAVVVLWHWSLSITHWNADGVLTMPNPVAQVPGGWALTWVLQVMPVFFLVGGYANLAGWRSVTGRGAGAGTFLRVRARRLLVPFVPWLVAWAAFDLSVVATGRRSVLEWGLVLVVPLWFLGVYLGVVAAVPVTARLHAAWGWRVPAALAAVALAADALRLGAGRGDPFAGLVGSAAVWLLVHQLGYFWRDGTATSGGPRRALVLTAAGLAALAALTLVGPYPRSMVALPGDALSNMFPTTTAVAALALFQLGLALLARPALDAWLRRPRVWRAVRTANALAMPVFVWHMTALLVFIGLHQAAGFALADESTASWWLTRPLWVVGPGLVLAALLLAHARLTPPRQNRTDEQGPHR